MKNVLRVIAIPFVVCYLSVFAVDWALLTMVSKLVEGWWKVHDTLLEFCTSLGNTMD